MMLAIALLLTGCESLSEPTPPPETPAPSPTLQPLAGPGYTTKVPPGWVSKLNDPTQIHRFSAGGQPLLLIEHRPTTRAPAAVADLPTNIAVVKLRDPIRDEKVLGYLTGFPDTKLRAPPKHYALGADEGVLVVYTRLLEGTPVETLDMVVNHHGLTHEVFLNTTVEAFPAQVDDVTTVMDAWSWADGP